jgi:hypothetical protein
MKPNLKPYTFAIRTSQRCNHKLQKSMSLPTYGRKIKKHESTTMAIRNAGESADMKVITFNKFIGNRTVKCLEIPHYA